MANGGSNGTPTLARRAYPGGHYATELVVTTISFGMSDRLSHLLQSAELTLDLVRSVQIDDLIDPWFEEFAKIGNHHRLLLLARADKHNSLATVFDLAGPLEGPKRRMCLIQQFRRVDGERPNAYLCVVTMATIYIRVWEDDTIWGIAPRWEFVVLLPVSASLQIESIHYFSHSLVEC
jgi:hypothetical protein